MLGCPQASGYISWPSPEHGQTIARMRGFDGSPNMELKELGNTGVMVPKIGLGTWKCRGGVGPLRRGIDLGSFLLDTVEMYRTEDVVGQAVGGAAT